MMFGFDPMADKRPWLSAYNYCQLNPVMRVDPTGMIDIMIEDFSGGGEGDGNGDPPAKSSAPKNQPGASSRVNQSTANNNGNRTASGQMGAGSISFKSQQGGSTQRNGGTCPDCLNPSTVGNNLLGLTYPGGNNPRSYNKKYNYSFVPTNLSEYPAIGHDRRYDNLNITGASGLFTDVRAIGADWKFVAEEFSIAVNPFMKPADRLSSGILGFGLGLSALPKTMFQLSSPYGFEQMLMWYQISNQGVNNTPNVHKH